MATFKYVGGPDGDQFFQGLPATDIDDEQLTIDERGRLYVGVDRGVYAPVELPAPPGSEPKAGKRTQQVNEQIKQADAGAGGQESSGG